MKMNTLLRALVCLVAVAGLALLAHAADRVTLKSGKVIEGSITREVEGAIWIKTSVGGVPVEEMYGPSDITKVERDGATAPAKADPVTSAPAPIARKSGSGVPKACVIT